jgi:diguanylate cyclase (GGDEF)-like protein/PAS domain S-box-containing protein
MTSQAHPVTAAGRDRVFDVADSSPFLQAAGQLERSRANLAETATYSGTWQWDATQDAFAISARLRSALPGLDLDCSPAELLTGSAGPVPAQVAAALPEGLLRALALASPQDRLTLALMLGSAWMHGAGFEVNHSAGDSDDPALVRHVGAVVTDASDQAIGMVGVLTVQPEDGAADPLGDVESAQRYRQLMRVLPSGVIIHQDGIIVDANPAILQVCHLDRPEELLGRSIMDMIVPEGRRRLMERVIGMSKRGSIAPPEEETLLLPDGSRVPVEIVSIRTTWRGRPAGQAVITDISERKRILDQLTNDATHDALTGLGNRRLIVDEITARLAAGTRFAVLFVDLDKFKDINDSYGHDVGDRLLLQVVGALKHVAERHPGTFVGRLSGDEFVLLTPDGEDATCVADAVCKTLATPHIVDSWHLVVTSSVGVAYAEPGEDRSPLDLIRDADVAMYRAKQLGRNRWVVFGEQMRQTLQRRVLLTDHLRRSVEDPGSHGMSLVYQPIIRPGDGTARSVETLIRWNEPTLERLFPDEFIPLAEETGLIVPLGYWILKTACEQLAAWRREYPQLARLQVAINLSPRQLGDSMLVSSVERILQESGMPASALCLEITETALAEDVETATRTLNALHQNGVSLSIDDFGAGYSSLGYLRTLPVAELKVDRSFVSGIGEHVRDETICASVISMAHALGLEVVAEGVETIQQQAHLAALGCDYIQGYFACRPVPPQEAVAYLLQVGC